MKQQIEKLQGHIIICGYSRLGDVALEELSEKQIPVVVIESDKEKIEIMKSLDILYIHGDATRDEILIDAGIKKAKKLVSVLPKDSDNLYVVLTAKELNPDIYIISRAINKIGEKRLYKAGASKIISPYRAGGQKIADGLLRPYVTELLDLASDSTKVDLVIEEILISESSEIIGKTISDLKIRDYANVIIIAVINSEGKMSYNPSSNSMINAKDTLICLGHKDDLRKLEKIVFPKGV